MSAPDRYAARRAWFAEARGRVTVRGLILGLVLIEVGWILAGVLFVPWRPDETGSAFRTFGVHLAFLSIVAATALVVRRFQGRNPLTLIGPPGRAVGDFLRVLRALAILFAVLYALPGAGWSGVERAMPVAQWALLLPLACLGVLIQTGAEELLYRGYLQQSLGAVRDHPVVWMALPSLLFGLSHYNPTISPEATLAHIIWTTAFGLAAADLTARTGSLGAAVGVHFAYNLPLVVLVAVPGELSGFALFHVAASWSDQPPSAIGLGMELFTLWMIWMAARIAIRR